MAFIELSDHVVELLPSNAKMFLTRSPKLLMRSPCQAIVSPIDEAGVFIGARLRPPVAIEVPNCLGAIHSSSRWLRPTAHGRHHNKSEPTTSYSVTRCCESDMHVVHNSHTQRGKSVTRAADWRDVVVHWKQCSGASTMTLNSHQHHARILWPVPSSCQNNDSSRTGRFRSACLWARDGRGRVPLPVTRARGPATKS
jgi:hypothetical protein